MVSKKSGKMIIPEGTTRIHGGEFEGREDIIDIQFPKTIAYIEKYAFYGCNAVEEITLPFVGESRTAVELKGTFGYIFGYRTEIITGTSGSSSSSYYNTSADEADVHFPLSYTYPLHGIFHISIQPVQNEAERNGIPC